MVGWILFVLTFIVCVFLSYLTIKAARLVREYEEFFDGTLKDLVEVKSILKKITSNRELLAMDPEVQVMTKAISAACQIIDEYTEIRKEERK